MSEDSLHTVKAVFTFKNQDCKDKFIVFCNGDNGLYYSHLTNTSNQIFFNGSVDTSSVTVNGNIFYYGQTILTISGNFEQANMYMLFDNTKVELQKPIIYDDTCFPKLNDSIINIIIQI